MNIGKVALETAGKLVVVVACLLLSFAHTARAAESLDGFWMDSDGEVVIEVGPCGKSRCGRVAWLKQPNGPDGMPLRDFRNSSTSLQARPVCGLQVISGFTKQTDGNWGGGDVYVPDLGQSFSGTSEIINPTQVKVTGYIGLPIFGESEIWKKISAPASRCSTPEQVASGSGVTKPAPVLKPKSLAVTSR